MEYEAEVEGVVFEDVAVTMVEDDTECSSVLDVEGVVEDDGGGSLVGSII